MSRSTRTPMFYVGAQHTLTNGWTRTTKAAAIKHAETIMAQDGTDLRVIVKVIAIVRRKPQFTVEEVQ